jgi:hypothetical protein
MEPKRKRGLEIICSPPSVRLHKEETVYVVRGVVVIVLGGCLGLQFFKCRRPRSTCTWGSRIRSSAWRPRAAPPDWPSGPPPRSPAKKEQRARCEKKILHIRRLREASANPPSPAKKERKKGKEEEKIEVRFFFTKKPTTTTLSAISQQQ